MNRQDAVNLEHELNRVRRAYWYTEPGRNKPGTTVAENRHVALTIASVLHNDLARIADALEQVANNGR